MLYDGKGARANEEYVDPKELIALEEELLSLKEEHGILEKETWWMKTGDRIAGRLERNRVKVSRRTYIKLALGLGWFCGAHRFYCKQRLLGMLYLLFCWTGIPFAMTLIDLMIILPMKPDNCGMIEV